MSRIGKQPVQIPAKVTVAVKGQEVTVKGPKGELKHNVHPNIGIEQEDGVVHLTRSDDQRQNRALHGLERAKQLIVRASSGKRIRIAGTLGDFASLVVELEHRLPEGQSLPREAPRVIP